MFQLLAARRINNECQVSLLGANHSICVNARTHDESVWSSILCRLDVDAWEYCFGRSTNYILSASMQISMTCNLILFARKSAHQTSPLRAKPLYQENRDNLDHEHASFNS